MKPRRESCFPGFLFWIGVAVMTAFSDPPLEILLQRYSDDIRKSPDDYWKRVERASLIFDNGFADDTSQSDIDTLVSHSGWRAEGECLRARSLYVQGRLEEAKLQLRKNIRDSARVQQQARLLTFIESVEGDTASALEASRIAWDHGRDENDFIVLLGLLRGKKDFPERLIKQGLDLYPKSPGVVQSVFEVYFAAHTSAGFKKSLEIADRAGNDLWPLSLDWKIRKAQALVALQRKREAERVLLATLEILDNDVRLQGTAGEEFHRQIFGLLEQTETKP